MRNSDQTQVHRGVANRELATTFIHSVGGTTLFAGELREASLEFCEQNSRIALCSFPESLASLASAAGFAAVFDLVIAYGGRRLYLPTTHQRFYAISGIAVPAGAYLQWREQADSNGQVDIPSAWGLFLALRRAAIRFAMIRGWPTEDLYTTFGLSKKQLRAYQFDIDSCHELSFLIKRENSK